MPPLAIPTGMTEREVQGAIAWTIGNVQQHPGLKPCGWGVESVAPGLVVGVCRLGQNYAAYNIRYDTGAIQVSVARSSMQDDDGDMHKVGILWLKDLQKALGNSLNKALSDRQVAKLKATEEQSVAPEPVAEVLVPYTSNDLPPPRFRSDPRPNDLAVVIGIERYRGTLPKAEFAAGDAALVRDYFRAAGIPDRNMEFLVDDRATLSDVRKAVEYWLPNRAKPESRVLFYYSGHGAPDPINGDAYLVPYDGDPAYLPLTGYPLKQLYAQLAKLPVKEVVVLLDSCFSGSGGRSVLAKGARPLVVTNAPATLASNVAVLSSAGSGQISTSSPEKRHGLFTYHFLKALSAGKEDLAEIYGYVKPAVEDDAKSMNIEQSPTLVPQSAQFKVRLD